MTVYISTAGRILGRIQGTDEIIELNMPDGCVAVDDPPGEHYYYMHPNWIPMPPRPDGFNEFDYTTKQWIDPRTLDEIKTQKWAEIKSGRDSLEFGGFEFEGNTYDSDQVSQGRITGAAVAGVDQIWTLADNTTIDLSASQLQQLYAALQAHIANAHERGRIARQLIHEAETKDQVEAINL